jgi:hypothetical protein
MKQIERKWVGITKKRVNDRQWKVKKKIERETQIKTATSRILSTGSRVVSDVNYNGHQVLRGQYRTNPHSSIDENAASIFVLRRQTTLQVTHQHPFLWSAVIAVMCVRQHYGNQENQTKKIDDSIGCSDQAFLVGHTRRRPFLNKIISN